MGLDDAVQRLSFNGSVPVRTPAAAPLLANAKVTTLAVGPTAASAGGRTTSGDGELRGESRDHKLVLLPSGPLPPNPGEIVGSQQFGKLLRELCEESDYVLVDAPPMFAVGDAAAMASWVDGLLVVLHLDDTTAETLKRVEDFFTRTPAKALGIVVTGVHHSGKRRYYYTD
jgi:Mrp family chromosome partitioning ATPase